MNQQEAKKLVEKTFTLPFSEERFIPFVRNLLPELQDSSPVVLSNDQLPLGFREHVHSYTRLGTYVDPNGESIDVVVVKLKNKLSLDRARTRQRNLMAHYLKKRSKDAVLAAYITEDPDDWRFSFVKLVYRTEVTDKGKVKVKEEFTPAKRYSFLVGEHEPNHTAQKQIGDLLLRAGSRSLDQIEEAFNIESVTNEFFGHYKSLYLMIKDNLDEIAASNHQVNTEFKKKNIETVNFAKKLLGQIVFLYFLQKKGWLGVSKNKAWGTGDKRFLSNLFKNNKEENFFDDILESLFYKALATERNDDYFPALDCKVPFLNGGLFEPINGYDWENTHIKLDNKIIENVFDVFNLYNFTVREDEPLDKEVAVDPEMLGKVFENLLEIKDRRSKGTFYTPRGIVYFMCQESLVNYLDTSINNDAPPLIPIEDIRGFIKERDAYSEPEITRKIDQKTGDYCIPDSIRKHAKTIDSLLSEIRICDPAIGSGAFPVGIMQEIVRARLVLSTFLSLPSSDSLQVQGGARTPYAFKHHAIQHSLYGVDIDPGAVDIAKLRLWLSLVVDEDDLSQVKPLPNLDYKIVTGDSLLGYPYQRRGLEKLEALKKQFFSENNPDKKLVLREKIEQELLDVFINTEKSLGYQVTVDFRINFSEVFRDNGGFDVVIGNPPYIQLQKNGGELADRYEGAGFETFTRMGDIFMLFYERGHRILSESGNLCYITSNKWMRAGYGKKLRKYFLAETTPKLLIDFGDAPLFEKATTYTNILLFEKRKGKKSCLVADLSSKSDLLDNLSAYLNSPKDDFITNFGEERYLIVHKIDAAIKQKVEQQGVPLKDWDIDIYRGIVTGYNDAFIIDGKKRAEIIAKDPQAEEIIKPVLRGKDIKRYTISRRDEWVLSTFPVLNLDIDNYPGVKEYLKSFGKRLNQTGGTYIDPAGNKLRTRKKTGNKWFETQDQINYYEEFGKDKIVWGNLSQLSSYALDEEKAYINAPSNILTSDTENLKYLLALLNSRLTFFIFRNIAYSRGGKYYEFKKVFVEQLPIIRADSNTEKEIVRLVDEILAHKRANSGPDTHKLEVEIDALVYSLYDLTEDEIKFVEGVE